MYQKWLNACQTLANPSSSIQRFEKKEEKWPEFSLLHLSIFHQAINYASRRSWIKGKRYKEMQQEGKDSFVVQVKSDLLENSFKMKGVPQVKSKLWALPA